MSEQGADVRPRGESTLEASARELGQFVIRVIVLPITLLFAKPSAIARASADGNYRPLPSPFLLALTTGVVVSGVTSNLAKLNVRAAFGQQANPDNDFFTALTTFYGNMEGIKSILFAIPYIAVVWIAAGAISILMFRGVRAADILFAGFALCLAALVELALVGLLATPLMPAGSDSGTNVLIGAAFAVITLILSIKLVRLVLVVRKENQSSWIGAILACIPTLVLIWISGIIAAAVMLSVMSSGGAAPVDVASLAQAATARGDFRGAIALYDRALATDPSNASLFYQRARAFERAGNGGRALADYDHGIKLGPSATGFSARAAIRLEQGNYQDALTDMDRAIDIIPANPDYFNSRCMIRVAWGQQLDRAVQDCEEYVRLSESQDEYGGVTAKAGIANAHDSLGMALLRRGDLSGGDRDYTAGRDEFKAAATIGAAQSLRLNSSFYRDDAYYNPLRARVRRLEAHFRYGRGLAELRLGNAVQGRTEIAAAVAAQSNIADDFDIHGLTPVNPTRRAAPSE